MKRREFVKSVSAAGAGLLLRSPFSLHAQQPQPDPAIKRVLVMFKCHFDAGFIDTQYNVIHKRYFEKFFPQAIETARAANAGAPADRSSSAGWNAGGKRRYVWTTGSWLLYEYLEQASPADRKTMEQAIARGDIAWHALPLNWQTEMIGQSMIEGSLAISRALDKRFGTVTTGAKMTDVPGHTRGIVTPLARHGVTLLEIGVNAASKPAAVPPLFLWQDHSGATLPMMYHIDYGGIAPVPGSDLALVTRVRGDNSGPHTPEEIAAIHADLAARFPNAEIAAASLSEMANALQPYRAHLPVVTEEIGDTWIYGCASDPLKVARYREVCRLRDAWIASGEFQNGDATDLALLRKLLLEPEHTWGTDTKTWIDLENYKPADLDRMLDTRGYKVMAFSWQEKRQDLFDAVAALPANLRDQAQQAIESLTPAEPKLSAAAVKHHVGKPIETAHFILGLDAQTGAITRLRNKATGREWASQANPIALFTYQTLSQEDYQRFMYTYVLMNETTIDWAPKDFGKPNIEKLGAAHRDWHPSLAAIYTEETADAHRIVARLEIRDEEAYQSGLASFPRKNFLEIVLPKAEPVIHLSLACFEKRATRLPEALWLTFNPIAEDPSGWTLDISGEPIAPLDVVVSGNRHMHALAKGFDYKHGDHNFSVETIDAPVIALGERMPLYFSNTQPDLSAGIHSSLFNNAWGTNYIMWYAEDMRFRFKLKA